MLYVGLDVNGKSLVAYAVNERKQRVFEGERPASRAGLRMLVRQVGGGAKLVAFEADNQLKWIAETLKRMVDIQVHVVHPNEVKWIMESRSKTDWVDAKKLAELARGGLLQCAHIVVRMKSHGAKPLQQFFTRVMRRRGKKIAVVALARKLLTTAHGVLKSGQPYDPRGLQPA